MHTLPLVFRGDRLRALVVGGGTVALHKVEKLLEVGAHVTVIAPVVVPELEHLLESTRSARLLKRLFCTGDTRLRRRMDPKRTAFNLIIGATDDPAVNEAISAEAMAEGIPVNIVDVPELCSVYFAAQVRDEPLLVAISTQGEAPFLAKRLKDDVARVVDHWAPHARWAARFRAWVKDAVRDPDARLHLYDRFLDLDDAEIASWDVDNPPLELWNRWLSEDGSTHPE